MGKKAKVKVANPNHKKYLLWFNDNRQTPEVTVSDTVIAPNKNEAKRKFARRHKVPQSVVRSFEGGAILSPVRKTEAGVPLAVAERKHKFEVVRQGDTVQAKCDCGWESNPVTDWSRTVIRMYAEIDNHVFGNARRHG